MGAVEAMVMGCVGLVMLSLDGLWWLCAGSSTYSPSQLGDHQF
jgi:hypothetical protein